MQASNQVQDGEPVSLLKVKETARRLLPMGSIARSVILAEKDALPAAEALAKFEIFDRPSARS